MSDTTSRRRFLKQSTLTGVGWVAASPWVLGGQGGEAGVIRVGLLGAGLRGEVLLNACLTSWESVRVRFTAVCDIWEQLNLRRALELLGKYDQEARGYTDLDEMLRRESDLDAVLVATPDHCHAEQVVKCLQAGLAVYCEAPLSSTLEGAREMVLAARECKRPLQVGYQRRSNPQYIHTRNRLLGEVKLLGRVSAAEGRSNHPAQSDLGWSRRWALNAEVLGRWGYPTMHAFKNWRW